MVVGSSPVAVTFVLFLVLVERERNISILTILRLSFLIFIMKHLKLLFAIKLLAQLNIIKKIVSNIAILKTIT